MARHFQHSPMRNLTQPLESICRRGSNRREALARRQSARDYNQGRPPCLPESARDSSRVALGDGMRAVRLVIAVLIVSPILILAFTDSKFARQPCAQVTAAPGPVTLTAPVAPGQPQAFSTIGALPALAAGARHRPARSGERCRDAARISMHLFDAGDLDRVGRRRLVVQLFSCEPIGEVAMRQLHPEREPAVGVHSARGIRPEPATADDLQWRGLHAARTGGNFGGTILSRAALAGSDTKYAVHAMRVQLNGRRPGRRISFSRKPNS